MEAANVYDLYTEPRARCRTDFGEFGLSAHLGLRAIRRVHSAELSEVFQPDVGTMGFQKSSELLFILSLFLPVGSRAVWRRDTSQTH